MLIASARVSTQDQNLPLQTKALAKAGCKKIFEDKISGSRTERPGWARAQEALREGDTLVVWKLDRLGRSVKHLVDMVGDPRQQGIQFKSLTDAIDTGTPSSSFRSWRVWPRWSVRSLSNVPEQASKLPGKIKSTKKLLTSGVPLGMIKSPDI
jgi:hypothetical protein